MYETNVVLIKSSYRNPYKEELLKKAQSLRVEKKVLYVNEYGDHHLCHATSTMDVVVYGDDTVQEYKEQLLHKEFVSGIYELIIIDGDFQNFQPELLKTYDDVVFVMVVEDLQSYDEEKYLVVDLDDIKHTSLLKRKSRATFYQKRLEQAPFIQKFNLFD